MESAKEIGLVVGLIFVALAVGAWLDATGWACFVAALIWIWIQSREFQRLRQWTKRPLRKPQNARDSWFTLAYRPFRSLTRERARTHAMARRLRDVLGLADVIPDGLIVLSPNGDIEGVNPSAKQLLQLTDADVGLALSTVIRNPDFVSFIRANQHDEPLEFQSPFDVNQSLEARRFDVEAGRTIVMVRDITALNRLLTMRQNFVANVSHELRTPLTVVTGYMETLQDPEQPDELKLELLARLPGPLKRMQSLVEDLLLLTRLESSPVMDQKRELSLNPLVHAAAQELMGLYACDDQVSVVADSEHKIFGIDSELHSVCVNLLSNAIRYSPAGGAIEISCRDEGDKVRLTVKDHGLGIAPEHLSRLTERFYRIDLAGSRARGGTGLGLAIVKHVLRRHNSSLEIESQPGVGSTFYCDFERVSNTAGTLTH